MAYNMGMIFVETSLFTRRIVQAMDDDTYGELQEHLTARCRSGHYRVWRRAEDKMARIE